MDSGGYGRGRGGGRGRGRGGYRDRSFSPPPQRRSPDYGRYSGGGRGGGRQGRRDAEYGYAGVLMLHGHLLQYTDTSAVAFLTLQQRLNGRNMHGLPSLNCLKQNAVNMLTPRNRTLRP